MRTARPFLLCLVSLATLLVSGTATATPIEEPIELPKPIELDYPFSSFNRSLFPSDFLFGAGNSAYQAEGASDVDYREPSIWDTFTKQHPEKIVDHSSGNVGADFYHRYKDDLKIAKEMGLTSFRFSLSWSRIFPKGKGGFNPYGVYFYKNLIDEVLANGLIPFVTLFHWDLPQALEDEYGGFLSKKIVGDFRDYADFCFETFGRRVKHWVTLNEPTIFSVHGYNNGTYAPGRCSNYVGNCTKGDSATEPYIVGHNLLLAHNAAATLYKKKYQSSQKGQIGITIPSHFFKPKTGYLKDYLAAKRALAFFFGWFAHPVTYGDYPDIMKSQVGRRLPKFTRDESESLKRSIDFLGVNYYTSYSAGHAKPKKYNRSYYTDMQVILTRNLGTPTDVNWLYMYPKGIYDLMLHIKETYNNPAIYITENGVAELRNDTIPVYEVCDGIRTKYHYLHLAYLLAAMRKGVNVKGYYTWSFSDSFEWSSGYSLRFGLVYIDYLQKLERYRKPSSFWLQKFLLYPQYKHGYQVSTM